MAEATGRELNTKATVAGGGAGTLLIAIATQIKASHPTLAGVMTYAAPSVSVAAAAAWVLIAAVATSFRSRYVTDRALKRAREMRDKICADPDASLSHKSAVREKVEHFERLSMALIKLEFDAVEAKVEP